MALFLLGLLIGANFGVAIAAILAAAAREEALDGQALDSTDG